MSDHADVLRAMEQTLRLDAEATLSEKVQDLDLAQAAALRAAISALEEKAVHGLAAAAEMLGGQSRPAGLDATRRAFHERRAGLPPPSPSKSAPPRYDAIYAEGVAQMDDSEPAPKSSSDSMEESVRDAALHEAMRAVSKAGGPDASWHCGVIRALMKTDIAAHEHKSWCRGDHSEGACVPDALEVDHGE